MLLTPATRHFDAHTGAEVADCDWGDWGRKVLKDSQGNFKFYPFYQVFLQLQKEKNNRIISQSKKTDFLEISIPFQEA